ncbi:terminase small subunit [Streptomyces iakyrus]|uniref:terminase small subunit n=1 Tax=Streptomyces iakyrus TaxID=68219 RepID=UPI0036EA4BD0
MADSETQPDEEDSKHPGGRPLKFQTPEELDLAIQLYFDKCDPHVEKRMIATGVSPNGQTMFEQRDVITEQKPYTMAGLARALGVSRQTLLSYSEREEFLDSVASAKARCEEYAESMLFSPYSGGAKFNLTNNYEGWSDKTEVKHDGDIGLFSASGLDIKVVDGQTSADAESQAADGS